MKPLYRHRKSLIALVQFVFLVQLVCGFFVFPLMVMSGESGLHRTIRDDKVSDMVKKYYESNNKRSNQVIVYSSSIGLLLSSIIAYGIFNQDA